MLMILCFSVLAHPRMFILSLSLLVFFTRYADSSGQIINPKKSTIFRGFIAIGRLKQIASSIVFNIGSLPFTYLGVPILKGKPKSIHLQPIIDKIKIKLASWKVNLLSFTDRIQLIKSVLYSMPTYSFNIYSWPKSLLKELESIFRNFSWSGDLKSRKLVTVSWKTICTPTDYGGLGLRSISKINEASMVKLCHDMFNGENQWVIFLRSRVIRGNSCIKYHIYSSIWPGIKSSFQTLLFNSSSLLGNGNKISFWTRD